MMGDRGAAGDAWGARDEASWWQGGAGELPNQQQINAEIIARSTAAAAATHQLYSYKMSDGFTNNSSVNSTNSYDYRIVTGTNTNDETAQQPWWYGGSVESHQQNSSPSLQDQSSPDPDQNNRANGNQQNQSLTQEQNQAIQQQNQAIQQQNQAIQQHLMQQQQNQQQTLQQIIQQQQQEHQQSLQQNIQQTLQVSQAQAQAIAQAQVALQQQNIQQHQQMLHDQIQGVQQLQIQAALQRQQVVSRARMPRVRAGAAGGNNKPRGRMTAYAFFVQACREEHKTTHPDQNVVFAQFSKQCAEKWNAMNEKEKVRFHELAEADKRRYEAEMANYVPPKDVRIPRGRKRGALKDPNAPKRSISAFFWFCNDERAKVKADKPEYTMADIAKELGRRWAVADPDTKGKYEKKSEVDRARYEREMTEYKKGPLAMIQQKHEQPEMDQEVGEYNGGQYK